MAYHVEESNTRCDDHAKIYQIAFDEILLPQTCSRKRIWIVNTFRQYQYINMLDILDWRIGYEYAYTKQCNILYVDHHESW